MPALQARWLLARERTLLPPAAHAGDSIPRPWRHRPDSSAPLATALVAHSAPADSTAVSLALARSATPALLGLARSTAVPQGLTAHPEGPQTSQTPAVSGPPPGPGSGCRSAPGPRSPSAAAGGAATLR